MGKGKGAIASWLEELLMQFHTVAVEEGAVETVAVGRGWRGGHIT